MREPSPRGSLIRAGALARAIHRVTAAAGRRPRVVLAGALGLALVGAALLPGIRIDTDPSKLVRGDDPWLAAYLENRRLFPSANPLILEIDHQGGREADRFADRLGQTLESWADISAVESFPPRVALSADGPHADLTASRLQAAVLNNQSAALPALVSKLGEAGMRRQLLRARRRLLVIDDPAVREALSRDLLNLGEHLEALWARRFPSRGSAAGDALPAQSAQASRLLLAYPRTAPEDTEYARDLIARVDHAARDLAEELNAAVSVTPNGLYAITAEAAEILQKDLIRITAFAFGGIFLVAGIGLRSLRMAALSLLPAAIALGAFVVVLKLAFEPVYFLTVGFGAIVLGISIDVSLHLFARFGQLRKTFDPSEAARVTMLEAGPPVLIGMTTTAGGFVALAMARNPELSQFGWLTSIGLLLSLAVTLIVFPALVALTGASPPGRDRAGGRKLGRFCALGATHPGLGILLAMPILIVGMVAAGRFSFNTDPLSLFPRDQRALRTTFETAKSHGLGLTAVSEVAIRARDFEQAMSVQQQVDRELESLVASKQLAGFDSISGRLAYPAVLDAAPAVPEEIGRAVADGRQQFLDLARELGFREAERLRSYYRILEMAFPVSAEEVGSDLRPVEANARFAATTPGRHQLRTLAYSVIEAESPAAILRGDPTTQRLASHLAQLRIPEEASLAVTSPLGVIERLNERIRADFTQVSGAALAGVMSLLWLFFRRVSLALTALLPAIAATVTVLGIAALVGIPFTPAGIGLGAIVVGIGIDDGVHILSRLRRQGAPGAATTYQEIGPVLSLTTVTTAVGFGALALSRHPTVAALGQMVALGVVASWFFTLFLMPAVLHWLRQASKKRTASAVGLSTVIFVLLQAASATAAAAGDDLTERVLHRLQTRFENSEAVSSQFSQRKRLTQFSEPIEIEGSLLFQKPDYLKLEMSGDLNLEILTNGESLWLVDHDLHEIETHPLSVLPRSELERLTGFVLVFDIEEALEGFSARAFRQGSATHLELVATNADGAGPIRVELELGDRDRLRFVSVEYSNGDRIETAFRRWRRRSRLPPESFAPTPPREDP